jgi:hypothetical protein
MGVRAVGQLVDAEAEYPEMGTVLQANRRDTGSQDLERRLVNRAELQLRHGSRMCHRTIGKRVAEGLTDRLFHVALRKQRHRMPQVKREQPQIIEPENVVRVGVRE